MIDTFILSAIVAELNSEIAGIYRYYAMGHMVPVNLDFCPFYPILKPNELTYKVIRHHYNTGVYDKACGEAQLRGEIVMPALE